MRTYEKYKDSGISWIGKVPEGWNKCRFKNFMTLITDASTSDNKIGLENIESGTGKYVQTDSEFEGNGIAFKPHDIVYGKLRPYLQKVWCAEFEGNAVGDFFVFRNKCNSTSSFLKYLLLSDNFTQFANGTTYGAKMPRVSSNAILDQEFYIPSLSEQEAIANYLDKKTAEIDKIIAEREKKIELLNELKSSIISRAVTKGINPHAKMKDSGIDWIGEIPEGWEVRRLKYIGESGNGLTYSPNDTTKDSEKGILVLRSSNIQDNKLSLEDNVFVNEAPLKLMVRKGDIIICSRNGSVSLIGKSILIEKDMNATFGAFMLRFRSKYNSKYVYYLVSDTISKYKGLFATTTINQLTKNAIASMSCAFAPENEQTEIVDFIENELRKIERTLQKVHSEIALLREYKQSLISEVVTGKRKVID